MIYEGPGSTVIVINQVGYHVHQDVADELMRLSTALDEAREVADAWESAFNKITTKIDWLHEEVSSLSEHSGVQS